MSHEAGALLTIYDLHEVFAVDEPPLERQRARREAVEIDRASDGLGKPAGFGGHPQGMARQRVQDAPGEIEQRAFLGREVPGAKAEGLVEAKDLREQRGRA